MILRRTHSYLSGRRSKQRGGMGRQLKRNIFHPVTSREHFFTERPCVGGQGFLELVPVL